MFKFDVLRIKIFILSSILLKFVLLRFVNIFYIFVYVHTYIIYSYINNCDIVHNQMQYSKSHIRGSWLVVGVCIASLSLER